MPRYHFSSVNGTHHPDENGVELPDIEAAHDYALKFAGEVLKSEPGMVWEHGQWRVEVVDSSGMLLFTVITLAIDAPVLRSHG